GRLRRHAAAGQSLAGLCRPPHPPQRGQKIKAAARCGSLCFVPLFCPPHGGKGMKNLSSILYFIAGFLFLLAAWSGSGPAFYAIGACFFALGIASWPKNRP